jgi:hypothetical protein
MEYKLYCDTTNVQHAILDLIGTKNKAGQFFAATDKSCRFIRTEDFDDSDDHIDLQQVLVIDCNPFIYGRLCEIVTALTDIEKTVYNYPSEKKPS